MSWWYLLLAGLFEVVWAAALKYTDGFTKPLMTAFTVAAMIVSVVFLALAVRTLPLGTAYAIWTGIGAVGTVIFGIVALGEPVGVARIACVAMIVAGVIGLKLTAAE